MPARKRRSSGPVAALVVVLLILTAARWAAAHPVISALILFVFAVFAVLAAVARFRGRLPGLRRPLAMADPHRMGPTEFEHFLADLCARDGCTRVQVVGGANDHGADVLYVDPKGRRGLIQAKRYTAGNSVGNEHVQIVNGTYRDAHGCAHAAIVTTSHFTEAAKTYAQRVGIRLLDSHRLDMWARGYQHAAPWN